MEEKHKAWIQGVIDLCQAELNNATPATYEHVVDRIQEALDTCPEP